MLASFRMPLVAKFYFIIPALAGICLLDFFLFNESIKKFLPTHIENLILINLVFNLPHIIASEMTLAKREYIREYIKPILVLVILCCIFSVTFTVFFPDKILLWFSILTITHVVGQQFGLCASLSNAPIYVFRIWKYLGVILGVMQYLYLYNVKLPVSPETAVNVFLILSVIFTGMAIYLFFNQKNQIGRHLTIGNWGIVMSPILFMHLGYPVFTSFIPRFVHDLTAFYAYFVHNYNYQHSVPQRPQSSGVFQVISLTLFTLIIPIILAAPFTLGWFGTYGIMFTLMASLFHYGIEGYVWRQGYLPRKYLKI